MSDFLVELFKRVEDLAHPAVRERPNKNFFLEWKELCGQYDEDIVILAWSDIKKMAPWKYFFFSIWEQKLKYHKYEQEEAKKRAQERKKHCSKSVRDDNMAQWSENLKNWQTGQITRIQYVKTALEIGQMTPFEYDKEINLYMRRNDNGFDYIKRSGLI